jgi:hypothetical protein
MSPRLGRSNRGFNGRQYDGYNGKASSDQNLYQTELLLLLNQMRNFNKEIGRLAYERNLINQDTLNRFETDVKNIYDNFNELAKNHKELNVITPKLQTAVNNLINNVSKRRSDPTYPLEKIFRELETNMFHAYLAVDNFYRFTFKVFD